MSLPRVIAALAVAVLLCLGHIRPAAGLAGLDDQARCLALAVYWEAKSEGREGMLAVASVVLNRVAHGAFPDTICAVVEQGGERPPCQFSWWCDGRSDRPTEARSWALAREVAAAALARPPRDATRGALFFHSVAIEVPWARERERTARIGRHLFYR